MENKITDKIFGELTDFYSFYEREFLIDSFGEELYATLTIEVEKQKIISDKQYDTYTRFIDNWKNIQVDALNKILTYYNDVVKGSYGPDEDNQNGLYGPDEDNQKGLYGPDEDNQKGLYGPDEDNQKGLYGPDEDDEQGSYNPDNNNEKDSYASDNNTEKDSYNPDDYDEEFQKWWPDIETIEDLKSRLHIDDITIPDDYYTDKLGGRALYITVNCDWGNGDYHDNGVIFTVVNEKVCEVGFRDICYPA